MIKCHKPGLLFWAVCLAAVPVTGGLAAGADSGPKATVVEYEKSIKTYPYFDANPVPSVALDKDLFRFYPYFIWNGYSHKPEMRKWQVIRLENPYIRLTVLPGVGGKVWGAIDKSSGYDFIYKNGVLKFRSIGIRGPWTSGGIEHNFGLDLGHAPWTASAVDYVIQKHDDGSVSVTVGGLDLASRTQWREEIRLPANKAYFETNGLWFNATPLPQSYLSWENTAVHAGDDLKFFYPGRHTVTHGGEAHPWPIDEAGRDLSWYRNSDYDGNHSYHVMGEYTDWYAEYWENRDVGSGHWAPYTDAPGKKIWIWSLAREGAIWTDLLTDTSGQYIETQAGVKFNQAVFGSGANGPFDQLIFSPYRTDNKREIWFPFDKTGGVVDASPWGVLNVERPAPDTLEIIVNALQTLHAPLKVTVGGKQVYRQALDLEPTQLARVKVRLPSDKGVIHVSVGGHKLFYTSDAEADDLERPVHATKTELAVEGTPKLYRRAENSLSMRLYDKALHLYQKILETEPTNARALTRIAEIYCHEGRYQEALRYALRVLEVNTYNPDANFIYGVVQHRLGDLVDAKDGLSWAAKSLKYRSGAFAKLASIFIQERNFPKAIVYGQRALNYNRKNLLAYKLLAVAYRHNQQADDARRTLKQLLEIDPLDHFARFEQYLLNPTTDNLKSFKSMIRNELPVQTYLELAMTYIHADLRDEAVRLLKEAPKQPVVYYWLAYLDRHASEGQSREYLSEALAMSPSFVFPFRWETIPVLQWAAHQKNSWKTKYYLGLLYWSKHQRDKAVRLFEECADQPDFAPFYIARGRLLEKTDPESAIRNYQKAVNVNPKQWRGWHYLIATESAQGKADAALANATKAYARFGKNQVIGLDYVVSLTNKGDYRRSLSVLQKLQVLPAEHTRRGLLVYRATNILHALANMQQHQYQQAVEDLQAAKKWPEHLGRGRPYHPDDRLQDYLLALCYQRMGQDKAAASALHDIISYTRNHGSSHESRRGAGYYVSLLALEASGKKAEAHQLMQAWADAEQKEDPWVRWAAARFAGNEDSATQIGRKLSEQHDYPLRWRSDWSLLRKALQQSAN